MLETLLLIFVTAAAGLVAFLIIYARWNYGTLEKLGVPVAKPHFILGSDPDAHLVVHMERDLERYRKYGPVFGVYEGREPRLFVADPDMIYHIMVKDFDHFYDRSVPDWGHEVFANLLDFLPGEKWKTVRSALTPMFTSSRIRNGGKSYINYAEKRLALLKKQNPTDRIKLDIKSFFAPVFVEFTSEYFLCVKISDEGDIKDNFIYKMVLQAAFDEAEASAMWTYLSSFPFIQKIFTIWGDSMEGLAKFIGILEQVLESRKAANKDTSNGKDFIDVMVSMLDKLDTPEYKRLGINKICVESQAFEMFIAGFDSVLTTSSILSYYIASNPSVQEKLLEEIDTYFSKPKKERDSGDLGDLAYLTACVKEAIRLNPSFTRPERLCMKEWSYKNEDKGINIKIPKGTSVMFPSWATNRNPEVFKDPEEFRPERFYKNSNESENEAANHLAQYANTSFGHGPRNCPGQRMGIEMIKAGLVTLLKDFRLEKRHDTKAQLQEGITMLARYKPIMLDIVKRVEQ